MTTGDMGSDLFYLFAVITVLLGVLVVSAGILERVLGPESDR